MIDCNHSWQSVDAIADPSRPRIKCRCERCGSFGVVLDPSGAELVDHYFATPQTPAKWREPERVTSSSANVETLPWYQD